MKIKGKFNSRIVFFFITILNSWMRELHVSKVYSYESVYSGLYTGEQKHNLTKNDDKMLSLCYQDKAAIGVVKSVCNSEPSVV